MRVNPLDSDALSVREAAKLLDRSPRTVMRWITAGELPAAKLGGRWYTSAAAIMAATRRATPPSVGPTSEQVDEVLNWQPPRKARR